MESCFRQKHKRTLARDDIDRIGSAELDRLRTDGTLPAAAVHPNPAHASLGAVPNHCFRNRRGCHQDCSIDGRLHILQASKAAVAANLVCVRIYWNHVVSPAAKLLEQHHAEIFAVA